MKLKNIYLVSGFVCLALLLASSVVLARASTGTQWVVAPCGAIPGAAEKIYREPLSDAYEPDDTCGEASAISTDGVEQMHTFHDQGDEDWVVFQATAGITYVIQIREPTTPTADVVVTLYDYCEGSGPFDRVFLFSSPSRSKVSDIRLSFVAPDDGSYYLHVSNRDANIYGSDAQYFLSVRDPSAVIPGALVLVAGRSRL